MRLGIDVGGTNLDGILLDDGKILRQCKLPADDRPLVEIVADALDQLLQGINPEKIALVHLSTTVATNAIIERKTRPVGLVLQRGPGIWENFSSLSSYIYDLDGYVDHRGILKEKMTTSLLQDALSDFKIQGLDALAVVSKFSPRHGEEEIRIAELAEKDFAHISLGHTLSGKLNFPRRVRTTYFNAAVAEVFAQFADSLSKGLFSRGVQAPIHILKADGGTMPLDEARKRPVETILSGPAASFMGMMALLENKKDAVLIDIGGTTSDFFFVVDEAPLFEPTGAEIDGHKTLVRALFSRSIGLGGDSAIRVEEGKLEIGPRRLGKPICLGGSDPTPTDAMVALAKLDAGESALARQAMEDLGRLLAIKWEEAAEKVLKHFANMLMKEIDALIVQINTRPLYTVREVLENRLFRPEEVRLIGGPAAILRPYLEEAFHLPTCLPGNYQVANAIGAALAIPSFEAHLIADTGRGKLSVPELGIYESIDSSYNLAQAEEMLIEALGSFGREVEIIEAESFNMIDGWNQNRNIRVKAQIKPGLAMILGGEQ